MDLAVVVEKAQVSFHRPACSAFALRIPAPDKAPEPTTTAHHRYVRGNIRHHLAGRSRPFELSTAIARAIQAASARGPTAVAVEADLLAALVTVGDRRLVIRAIESLVAQAMSEAAPGSTLRCRLALDNGEAVLTLGCPSSARPRRGAGPAIDDVSPVGAEAGMQAAVARLVIEEHNGRVQRRAVHDGRGIIDVRLPAGFL